MSVKLSELVNKKSSKEVAFLGSQVKISKLSVADVLKIQELAKNTAQDDLLGVVKFVIRASVEGAEEISDDQFNFFPMEDLSKLSNQIMEFSGIGSGKD